MSNRKTWNQLILLRVPSYLRGGIIVSAYIGSRVAQRSYGVPSVDYEPTYDNLGRITEMDYGATLVNLDYDYVANENNIDRKTFDHRTNGPYNQYAYDDLDRLIDVDYLVNGTPDHEETFVMDTLGNRTGDQILTEGTVDFTVQSSTNRYTSIGGNTITHDFAGNMTTDKDGYKYYYAYENRLVKIEDSSSVEVATHDYDALGRRIRVIDKSADPDVTTLYYHNPEWQVLIEFDESDWQRYYVYGNYIDEPLVMRQESDSEDYYYAQDHLYSVVALTDDTGTVVERYEYASPETANIAKGYYSLAYYLTEEYPAEETIEQIQNNLKAKGCVGVKWSKEDMKVYTREGQGKGEFVLNKEMTEKYQKGIPDDLHLQQTKWRVNDRMQLGVSHEWLEDWITPNDNRLSITLTYKDTKEMNKLFVYYSVATSSTTRYGYVRKYKELHPELFEVDQDEKTMSDDGIK